MICDHAGIKNGLIKQSRNIGDKKILQVFQRRKCQKCFTNYKAELISEKIL